MNFVTEKEMTADLQAARQELADSFPVWPARSLSDHFDWCAERWPDRNFCVLGDRSTTYAGLIDRSWHWAGILNELGVQIDDHVGLLIGNSVDFVALRVAISRLGARAVPLNYLWKADELVFALGNAGCKLLVYEPIIVDVDAVALLNDVVPAVRVKDNTLLAELIRLRSPEGESSTSARFSFRPEESFASNLPAPDRSNPNSVGELLYSSGSTGFPKGVLVPARNSLDEGYGTALSRGLRDGWVAMTALPSFHVFGWIECIMPTTFVGGTVIFQRKFDPREQLEAVARHGVNDFVGVPTMTDRLVELAAELKPNLTGLQALFSAGNAVPESAWRRAKEVLGVQITTGFGLTEAAGTLAMVLPEDDHDILCNTVGRLKNHGVAGLPELGGQRFHVRLVEPGTENEVSDGVDGEVQIKGPGVMAGYWRLPEETEQVLRDGWLSTGDIGRMRPDGALMLTGRIKELYKTGGELVAPVEVERALTNHSAVRTAIVVGVPDKRWGEAGCAWVLVEPGASVTEAELIEYCKARLARFKVPQRVFFFESEDDIPLGTSGKIQRQDLRARSEALL